MTIDWTQPCETVEDPPRPVRVLATDCGGDYPIAVLLSREPRLFTKDGFEWLDADGLALRNVAPPKPVQYVKWVALYSDGGSPSQSFHTKEACEKATLKHERVEFRRIAWMSDGSPVVSDAAGKSLDDLHREVLEWRTKAETLQSEVERLGKALQSAIDRRAEAELEARSLRNIRDDVERMKPVVEAAVAYVKADNTFRRHATYVVLHEAVRTYQSQPKKTAAEAVANVAEMMGPAKSCATCRWGHIYHADEPCNVCADNSRRKPFKSQWEPRND